MRRCSVQSRGKSGNACNVFAVRSFGCPPSRTSAAMSGASQASGRVRLTLSGRNSSRSVISATDAAWPSIKSSIQRLPSAIGAIMPGSRQLRFQNSNEGMPPRRSPFPIMIMANIGAMAKKGTSITSGLQIGLLEPNYTRSLKSLKHHLPFTWLCASTASKCTET